MKRKTSPGTQVRGRRQPRIMEWLSGAWSSTRSFFVRIFTSDGGPNRRRPRQRPSSSDCDSFRESSLKSKSKNSKSKTLQITKSVSESEQELTERTKRDYKTHLLILGLPGAGKSRLIEELIHQKFPPSPDTTHPHFTEIESEHLSIIEGPGLGAGAGFETDAAIVGSIKNYLERTLPIQIPNAVLILTRFDDNRFEGESSDFTRMLHGIRYLRKSLGDSRLTNVVLVLTFKDLAQDADVEFKLLRFRAAFDAVFPESNGIRIVTIGKCEDNIHRKDLIMELCLVAEERGDVDFQEALKSFSYPANYSIATRPTTEFTPSQGVVFKIMDELNSAKSHISSDESDSGTRQGLHLFPITIPYSKIHSSPDSAIAKTWLRKGTLVRMANGTEMEIDVLRTGDKLLNFKLKVDVIQSVETSTLRKLREEQNRDKGNPETLAAAAMIYCTYIERGFSGDDKRVLQYTRGRTQMRPYVEPIDPVSEDEVLFCIQMNHLDGTYIGDNCVFKHRVPPYSESTRL